MARQITRDSLGKKSIRKPVPVPVPELREEGDTEDPVVFVRHLDGQGRTDLGKALRDSKTEAETQAAAVVACVCDEAGSPIFTADGYADALATDGQLLFRLAEKSLDVNGFGKRAAEEAEKN